MTPQTPTLPPDDPRMWRRLLSRAHPDTGGSHELFIWVGAVRNVVCGPSLPAGAKTKPGANPSRRREGSTDNTHHVPFDGSEDFAALTRRALAIVEEVPPVYADLLRLLSDCYPEWDGPLADQQQRGASYRSLAAIAHKAGMTKSERVHWYRVAESVPLTQRHAGHILSKL